MDIYIQKFNSQLINEQQAIHFLNTGELLANDLACLRGMQEWKPLGTLPELPPIIREIYYLQILLKKAGIMLRLWQKQEDNILLYKKFETEVTDWEKTVTEFNDNFPNQQIGINAKMWLYFYKALLRVKSNAFTEFEDGDETIIGALNEWQRENANEAVVLLNKALEIADKPEFHLLKFMPLLYLREIEEIVAMLGYVVEKFDDDAVRGEAVRQMELIEDLVN